MLRNVLGSGMVALLQTAIWLAVAVVLSPISGMLQRASAPQDVFWGLAVALRTGNGPGGARLDSIHHAAGDADADRRRGHDHAEVVGSLVVLAASVVLLGVLAGKIYRIGILSTGKRPTFRELVRWLRMA